MLLRPMDTSQANLVFACWSEDLESFTAWQEYERTQHPIAVL